MKVCIAEKPSVAREIAYVLGAKSRKNGFYEGNGYAVTWTFGHFCSLKAPDDYNPLWKKWAFSTLPLMPEKFEIKLVNNKGIKKQFSVICGLLKKAAVVINCGDAGQEGELIQRWVLQQAKYKGKVLRLWIASLTPEAIRNGFRNLKNASQFDNLYYAGYSRAIGDWLLGMNATRLYTLKYGGYKQLLSVGRVQTPTLAMLVSRHKAIESFVPQPYWELQTLFKKVYFNCTKGRFLKKEDALLRFKQVSGQPFTILSFEKKKGREHPPKLFDLTSLQVHCNKRFAYPAGKTLQIAQKLYEQKMLTYPRVDTTYLPNDVYPKVPGILQKMTAYSQYTNRILGQKIRKSAKVFNDKKVTDHHAIIPTGLQKNCTPEEQNVYDAAARRFIAAFYPDCIVSNTTVIGQAAALQFKATGKEILEQGWRVLFPKPAAAKKTPAKTTAASKKNEEEKILPAFTVGETGPHQPEILQKQTQPPKPFTEATLLRAMETAGKQVDDDELRELMKASGIGRPSTRAGIIETLFKREYIQRKKKQLIPTETGIQLIDTIQNKLLKSAELTGQWEKQLREIESGTYAANQFIENMKQMVAALVTEVIHEKQQPRFVKAPTTQKTTRKKTAASPATNKKSPQGQTCPQCKQGELLRGNTAYGCSRWAQGCSFRLPFVFYEKKISPNQLLRLLEKGRTILLKGFKKEGQKVAAKVQMNEHFQLQLLPESTARKPIQKNQPVPHVIPCPKCARGTVVKGKTAYGCSRWKEGCNFRVAFAEVFKKAAGKTITKGLVWEILKG